MKTKIFRAGLVALALLPLAVSAIPAHEGHAHAAAPSGAEARLGTLAISGAYVRATLPNAPVAGGYLTIANSGAEADRLLSVQSPAAGRSEIHEMKMEGEVMKMRPLPGGLEIPAGASVALEPGGLHLMFMKLTAPFAEGTTVPVTLTFEKAGAVELALPVAPATAEDHGQHEDQP